MSFSKLDNQKALGAVFIALMIFSILITTIVIHPAAANGDWWNYSWQYRKNITIDHTKVAADLIDFPVLVDVTDSDLVSKAQGDGDDIVFADFSGNKLDHEVELYDGGTGHLVAWVRVPTLSSTTDTVIYMYYGNPTTSNQENPGGVWKDYVMVQHLEEISGTHYDSTANANDGTPYGGVNQNAVGKVDGADDFDGNDGTFVNVGSGSSIDNIKYITITAWVRVNSWPGFILDKGFTKGKAFYIHNEGYLCFVHAFTSGSPSPYGWWSTSTLKIGLGSWYHVAVTFDNTNSVNDPILYINGASASVTEGNTPMGTALSDSGYDAHIGCNHTLLGAHTMNGTIDELRISNPIRSGSWISTEYNNQFSPSTFYSVGSEEERVIPEASWLTDEHPQDGAAEVQLNPTLSITAMDFQGDLMTIIFQSNASGAWAELGRCTDVGNGTYTQVTMSMDDYSTEYYWKACATDGTNWTNETYAFTTRPENYSPSVSNPLPGDGAAGVCFDPLLSVDVSDPDSDSMTLMFSTNTTGTWQVIGTKSGGDGTYNQPTTGMNEYGTTYHWRVNVTDGKAWTNYTYTFTTWTEEDLYRHLGYYFCAGMPYAGESKDKDTFYLIWFEWEHTYPWPPHGQNSIWYAEFNRKTGWTDGTILHMSWLCNWGAVSQYTGCPHFGYFGDEYHVFWGTMPYLMHVSASDWSDFQSMTGGWTRLSDNLGPQADPWGSVYAFNNSYAMTFFTKQYASPNGNTIVYWIWDEASGWSSPAGIPVWSTSTGVTGSDYPHDCSGAVLLPINRTTWYLYYKSNIGGDHFRITKTFDAGQTWGPSQVADMPDQPHWRSHRPAFVRYGDNFYMIVNVGGSDISCYNSSDGEHWSNLQTIHSGSWYVPHGVMLDQSHILWTASQLGWYPDTERVGDEFGGVFEISEMIANPGKPSDPYPSDGATFPSGTTTTSLQVQVHGEQTYDVAFYWANDTFIGEDKLLQEGETAAVEVYGLEDGTYEWYAISRGTTYAYWGNEPDVTTDENRSDTFSFTIGAPAKLEMDPASVTCRKYCEQFIIEVNVTSALNIEDLEFEIHYNTTLLDYIGVTWNSWGSGTINVDETNGILTGYTHGTAMSGTNTLITLEFHAAHHHIWKACTGWTNDLTGTIFFQQANLSIQASSDLRYVKGVLYEIDVDPLEVSYTFSPIQGDVDNDGDVDIMDLRTVAAYYNVEEGDPDWSAALAYDLNCDGVIDIFDLVVIAVKFGTTYP